MTTYQQKITFGEMRKSGVRDVLIFAATIDAVTTSKPTPTAGLTMSGCRTSSRDSPVPPAARKALT